MGSINWRHIVFAGLLGALIAYWTCMRMHRDGGAAPTAPPAEVTTTTEATAAFAKLILSKDDVASWMTMNNTYTDTFKVDSVAWSGVLFQLGTFEKATFAYGKITLLKDGVEGTALTPESLFYWVNIIAADASKKDPIDPAQAFGLFPNATAAGSDCATSLDPCMRNRQLHGKQEVVNGLITYWHGANGYRVSAHNPPDDTSHWPDSFEFEFLDPVRVEIRSCVLSSATPEWTLVASYAADEVDEIVIGEAARPPDMGAKLEPAWPFP